ncbi:nucleotidyl transferase AbiEii/AbiGii toxin family protein [Nannocystis bainbridge]|uniref:Nucleotidyl transferase AbiEii/AbiGii toxin family protein n=1 Tax=Nannocystis bainbridge TaxID=2995303 RepID=A0ABT5E9P6_9BACT|nr:nucleotidyl transferase AbiEii/AbiGii toxin family protein [Nannocystis bainbridge]MDC0721592.1 nucleotidyl transferase AbiEii/AbiGii toxin family protein [Nannocystis bainbridge]
MSVKKYDSALGFKQALDTRLRAAATQRVPLTRQRQRLVFERFLARIFAAYPATVTLKGGFALELRIERARATRDVDLRWVGDAEDLQAKLRAAVVHDLGDFFRFELHEDPEHPEIVADGAIHGGRRFRVECSLSGQPFADPFGVDVVFGEPSLGEPEVVAGEDALAFIGVSRASFRVYPLETHVAEKLHAYTLPRTRMNSRVKDLPDLALLASVRAVERARLLAALELTFSFRRTHPLLETFPDPPDPWEAPYARMARQHELPWPTLPEVTAAVRAFLGPVLGREAQAAVWDPATWTWRDGPLEPEHVQA